jgi:hypothetical protein
MVCLLKDVTADLLSEASRGPEANVSSVKVIESKVGQPRRESVS